MPRKLNTRKASSSSSFRTPPASRCSDHCRIDLCASGSWRHRSRATAKAASSIHAISCCGRPSFARRKRSCWATIIGWCTSSKTKRRTMCPLRTSCRPISRLRRSAMQNAKQPICRKLLMKRGGFQISACDWDFYSEKVRKAKYDFDESEVRPYYELNHVIVDGVFFAANKEYGLTFKERHDLPVYQPDVHVWEVYDRDGKPLAIFIGDYYARPSKRGGAWMNAYVPQ